MTNNLEKLVSEVKSRKSTELNAVLLSEKAVEDYTGEVKNIDEIKVLHPGSDKELEYVTLITEDTRINHLTKKQVEQAEKTIRALAKNLSSRDGKPSIKEDKVPHRGKP